MVNDITFNVRWRGEKLTFKAVLNSYEPHIFLFDEFVGFLHKKDDAVLDYDKQVFSFMKDETTLKLKSILNDDVSSIVPEINAFLSITEPKCVEEEVVKTMIKFYGLEDDIELHMWLLKQFAKSEFEELEYAGDYLLLLADHSETKKLYYEWHRNACCGIEQWSDTDYKGRLWKFGFTYGH